MSDDQDGCEWVNVSSGSPGQKAVKWLCVCMCAYLGVVYQVSKYSHIHTRTHPFNGPFSRTTQVSRYQKGKTNLDFTDCTHCIKNTNGVRLD